MKTINNIIIVCVLASLQVHGAESTVPDFDEIVAHPRKTVKTVKEFLQMWKEGDQRPKQTVKLLEFMNTVELHVRIKGVIAYVNFFVERSLEDANLLESQKYKYSGEVYKYSSFVMASHASAFLDQCTQFLQQSRANESHPDVTIQHPKCIIFNWKNFIELLHKTASLAKEECPSGCVDISKEMYKFLQLFLRPSWLVMCWREIKKEVAGASGV
ncbi:MAG: hypothetical protein OXC30_00440 [Alphaproteobacteria bacterium]|nr:hypothetical protein [Alphaproteobacteria bacterium]